MYSEQQREEENQRLLIPKSARVPTTPPHPRELSGMALNTGCYPRRCEHTAFGVMTTGLPSTGSPAFSLVQHLCSGENSAEKMRWYRLLARGAEENKAGLGVRLWSWLHYCAIWDKTFFMALLASCI